MKLLVRALVVSAQRKKRKQSPGLMRCMVVLLLACNFQTMARNTNQNITLSLTNAPLTTVFTEIRKQTGFDFLFKSSWLLNAKLITVKVTNTSLETALSLIFKDQPLTYQIIEKTVILKPKSDTAEFIATPSKPIDITGKVVNEKGEAVAGVSVSIKGTNIVTSTNLNGEFSLSSVDQNAVLAFTSVNMETFELKVSGKQELFVSLKTKVAALGDVVVTVSTGYEDIPKERSTGSFVKIDNATLNKQAGTNILQRLNNVTSGLMFNVGKNNNNPQSSTNISIRGLNTINGPLDPLIVLDNFIYEGDINNINPNDVESISILKDAAATSIWGARAGNGVIVITTKRGRFNQKLKVDFNANVIISQKPDLFYLSQITSADYINVEQLMFNRGFFDNQISNSTDRPPLTPATEVFLSRRNQLISASDSAAQINALKNIDSRDQYNKYFYQNATTQQYSLNLRGGGNNIAWLISGGYDKSDYTLKNTFNKANIRFVNTYKPIKNIQVDMGVYYTSSKARSGVQTGFPINGRQVPYLQFVDNNGSYSPISRNRKEYTDTAGSGKLFDWNLYPLEDYKHDVTTTRLEELIANLGISYKVSQSISLNFSYQYQKQSINSDRLADQQSFYTRDLVNTFTQIDNVNGVVNYVIPTGSILDKTTASLNSHNLRGQLSYAKTWGDHSISAIAGTELREIISKRNGYRYYGYTEDPLSYGNVDFRNLYPTYITGYYQQIPNAPSISPTTNNRFVSLYANASYTYKTRYILNASARKDASNIFGLSTNDKWNPLWSTGIGWDISREAFYRVNWLNYLKIRASYGYSGNIDVNKTPLPISSSGQTDLTTNLPVMIINNPNNPLLRWEKIGQFNIGIDLASKGNIVSGSIDYYRKKGTDLYGVTAFDYTAFPRTTQVDKNVANMKGSGIDVSIKSINIDKSFKWTTNLLFNYNTNKTTAYFATGAQNVYSLIAAGKSITPVVGYPLYAIAAYKWAGLSNTGDPQGYLNGQVSTDYNAISAQANTKGLEEGGIVYKGPSSPTKFGSLFNEFSWKGFFASVNISYSFGYYFRKTTFTSDALINNGFATSDYSKRWQKPGDESTTNIPAFVYTDHPNFTERDLFYAYSEVNVLKADNIRLQFINLGYTFKGKIGNLVIDQMQFYVNAANLGIIWKSTKEHIDPDYPSSLSVPKSLTIGIRSTF